MKVSKMNDAQTRRFRAVYGHQNRANRLIFLLLIVLACGQSWPLTAGESAWRFVSGAVLAEDSGKPIEHALVRASSPPIDMRLLEGRRPDLYDAMTDANGHFTIKIPFTENMSKNEVNPHISLNAFAPGYGEAAGSWVNPNYALYDAPISIYRTNEFIIKLRPAFYVAGRVVDESGQPFPGAFVAAMVHDESSTICVAAYTEDNGRFQIFDFPLEPLTPLDGKSARRGQLSFFSSIKLTRVITNVYAMNEAERTNLQVILRSGHEVKGVITSAGSRDNQPPPPAHAMIEVVPADKNAAQRRTVSNADGRFEVRGLPDGELSIRAHTSGFEQGARRTVQLEGRDAEINLRLEPVVFKHPPKPVRLWGMELASVTPELQTVYDLDLPSGVLVLDPGTNSLRLGIGALSQGECFWIVGRKQINNLPDMVAELLRIEAIAPPGDPNEGCHGRIRVVYSYRNAAGTMTQTLKLTDEEIAELKNIRLAAAP
jgi:hypothetical protein